MKSKEYHEFPYDSNENEMIYRPLLFHSEGYASSQLIQDTQYMNYLNENKTAHQEMEIPTTNHRMIHINDFNNIESKDIKARIRLETLSSRATTVILWLTYLSFMFAMVFPYVQSRGYFETSISLPGSICQNDFPSLYHPCLVINNLTDTASWLAIVPNVSSYADSMSLYLVVQQPKEPIKYTLSRTPHFQVKLSRHNNTVDETKREKIQTNMSLPTRDFGEKSLQQGINMLTTTSMLIYDIYIYGVENSANPSTIKLLISKQKEHIKIPCSAKQHVCNKVKLIQVIRDLDTLDEKKFSAYIIAVIFSKHYPNDYGMEINYEFAYTKSAFYVIDASIRISMIILSLLLLPIWLVLVIKSHANLEDKSGKVSLQVSPRIYLLPIQKWVFALGIVLILWQNPIYAIAKLTNDISKQTLIISVYCQVLAQNFLYVFWLYLMDPTSSSNLAKSILKIVYCSIMFIIDVYMVNFRFMHSLSLNDTKWMAKVNIGFVVLGYLREVFLLLWLVWIAQISYKNGQRLKQLTYASTRFQQLSFRFLLLESVLIFIFIAVNSLWHIFQLAFATILYRKLSALNELQNTVESATQKIMQFQSAELNPPLGQFIFLTIYVYLVIYVHLPPIKTCTFQTRTRSNKVGLSYHIEDRLHLDQFGFLTKEFDKVFCVETAVWLMELAWQAYFDPPEWNTKASLHNNRSIGYGALQLEVLGYELVAHLHSDFTDTHAIVVVNHTKSRLVVAFRGTTSKAHWKSSFKFHQESLQTPQQAHYDHLEKKSCGTIVKRILSYIPIVNMTLPRVHSGFWKAYSSISDNMKKNLLQIIDEHPGISIYITGHSMGAALAVLAAYDIVTSFNIRVSMYSFGGPRVGNSSFANSYNSKVPASYRVVMDGDFITGIPSFLGLYRHVGTEVLLDSVGNFIIDPSFVEQKFQLSCRRKTSVHGTKIYRKALALCFERLLGQKEDSY